DVEPEVVDGVPLESVRARREDDLAALVLTGPVVVRVVVDVAEAEAGDVRRGTDRDPELGDPARVVAVVERVLVVPLALARAGDAHGDVDATVVTGVLARGDGDARPALEDRA